MRKETDPILVMAILVLAAVIMIGVTIPALTVVMDRCDREPTGETVTEEEVWPGAIRANLLKESVANVVALPACTAGTDGETRVVLDTGAGVPGLYQCDGGATAVGPGGEAEGVVMGKKVGIPRECLADLGPGGKFVAYVPGEPIETIDDVWTAVMLDGGVFVAHSIGPVPPTAFGALPFRSVVTYVERGEIRAAVLRKYIVDDDGDAVLLDKDEEWED